MSLWKILTGGITELVGGWFEIKKQKQQQSADYESQKLKGSDDYDTEAQRQKQFSWSDEYLLFIHTFPIWGYVIPSETLTSRLDILWDKLGSAPIEWWVAYGGMIVSTFGLRFFYNKIDGTKLWKNK